MSTKERRDRGQTAALRIQGLSAAVRAAGDIMATRLALTDARECFARAGEHDLAHELREAFERHRTYANHITRLLRRIREQQ